MIKEVLSPLLLLATVAIVLATATLINTGVIYSEKTFIDVDPTSRDLNRLPIRGR